MHAPQSSLKFTKSAACLSDIETECDVAVCWDDVGQETATQQNLSTNFRAPSLPAVILADAVWCGGYDWHMASVFFKLRVNPNRLAALLNRSYKICASASVWATNAQSSAIISRLTPRLLSFALCLEWINGIITLHTLAVWSVIERTRQWTRPGRKSIASTPL